jgi:hypothetical protein
MHSDAFGHGSKISPTLGRSGIFLSGNIQKNCRLVDDKQLSLFQAIIDWG